MVEGSPTQPAFGPEIYSPDVVCRVACMWGSCLKHASLQSIIHARTSPTGASGFNRSMSIGPTPPAILRSQWHLDKEMYAIFLREMQLERMHFSFVACVVQQRTTFLDF